MTYGPETQMSFTFEVINSEIHSFTVAHNWLFPEKLVYANCTFSAS